MNSPNSYYACLGCLHAQPGPNPGEHQRACFGDHGLGCVCAVETCPACKDRKMVTLPEQLPRACNCTSCQRKAGAR